ncbi:DUF2075 domain-containing protein [Betaproteobacteria bacterium SCN2]|jgi:hypothetical protein|nr:DUF2075 domain-containing protein [Betaproteobacteria bacterium SCN2]
MAVLIPDTPRECPNGERIVFEKLGRDLDDDWIIMHSLGLVEHQKKLWGEIDIVVLSTKGIFVIEVKGGRVSCRDGVWVFEAPGKEPYTRKEGPWTQAKDAMFALRKALVRDAPDLQEVLFGYGVIMPHEHFTATGPEIEPAVLLDSRDFGRNLRFYIGDLMRHWESVYHERHGRVPRLPNRDDIRRIRKLMRPDIESAFSLGSYFNGLERELLQLTNGQIRAARGVANNPRTVIRGRAGTGKTIIAIEHARKLASQGLNVLYLCFNQMLARHVQQSLLEDPLADRIRVRHIHSLFREQINRAGMTDRLQRDDISDAELFGHLYPEVFVEAALQEEPEVADVLVIDEAQDILTAQNLDAVDLLLGDGLRKGRWHLFLDPMQNIYGKEAEETEARLHEAGFAEYDLYDNCRNTRQVALQTSIISGIDMAIEGALEGPECECVYYRDRDDFLEKLVAEVRNLVKADVQPRDIVILSTRRLENSLLAGVESVAGLPIRNMAEDPAAHGLHFSTMHAFKGLERNVVLAIDLDHIGDELSSMLHYAGLSRARGLLRAFLDEKERKAYQAQAQAFGRRLAGGGIQ